MSAIISSKLGCGVVLCFIILGVLCYVFNLLLHCSLSQVIRFIFGEHAMGWLTGLLAACYTARWVVESNTVSGVQGRCGERL